MTQEEARKTILSAIYCDDWLFNQLVFKGGNALSMIYRVGLRTSLDLDFSINDDFESIDEVAARIETALTTTFLKEDIYVFDYNFFAKPKISTEYWWGGYKAEFKLISNDLANELDYDIDKIRVQALAIDPASQKRKYSIEISKYEYVKDAEFKEFDGLNIFVYTPLLLAAEKLRALLQQHPKYTLISAETKRSRGRDLYDIWALCDYFSISLGVYLDTVAAVFDAKKVDMAFLNELNVVRELHNSSWADVELSVSADIEDYDFYFNYVNKIAKELYSKWEIDSPGLIKLRRSH